MRRMKNWILFKEPNLGTVFNSINWHIMNLTSNILMKLYEQNVKLQQTVEDLLGKFDAKKTQHKKHEIIVKEKDQA